MLDCYEGIGRDIYEYKLAEISLPHICDYVRFRTACLYALRYGSVRKNPDPEAEKRKIRMLRIFCRRKNYNKLEDIAEDGFIGIIYGDASSMSKQIGCLEYFMMMRYFSEVASDTVCGIEFLALWEHLPDKLSLNLKPG